MGRLLREQGGHCFLLQLLRSTIQSSDVGAPASSREGCRGAREKPLLMPPGASRLLPGSKNSTEQYETCP